MAETLLKIEPRSTTGSRAARLLRKSNLVPGVIYSHGETAENIAVDPKEIQAVVHAGKSVIDIETGGKKEKAIVREVQWCHLGREILHVDLRLHVPVQTKGMSPGVNSGGVLELPLHSLDVECLVTNAPTAIIVNISELLIGSAVHVRDLILPEGVKVLNEAELVVVHVVERRDEPAPTAVLAEPEVVTKKKVDESKE